MWSTAREVAAGDTVIIWLTRDLILPLLITPSKDFNTKFGNFKQSAFIGVPYGSKVPSPSGKGFLYILRPTPELWTLALPHRTQILYLADIAFVLGWLGVRRGSRVVEAGTGSGSFSHSVVRTVGSTGRLWSYEFHEARYLKAKEEFARHKMDDVVTLHHRNVCKDGFTIVDEADSVFLDLPAPWDAVDHAKKALRKDRPTRICTFSPCIEQVLRTITALNDAGFTDISTYETLLRPIEVFQQVPALASVSGVSEKIKASERRREEKRVRQVAANAASKGGDVAKEAPTTTGKKRKREGDEGLDREEREGLREGEVAETMAENGEGGKRPKPDPTGDAMQVDDDDEHEHEHEHEHVDRPSGSAYLPLPSAPTEAEAKDLSISCSSTSLTPAFPSASSTILPSIPSVSVPHPQPTRINVSKALPEVRGHTSYLTFAVLVPMGPFVSALGLGAGEGEGEGAGASVRSTGAGEGPGSRADVGEADGVEVEAPGSGSKAGDGMVKLEVEMGVTIKGEDGV